MILFSALTSSQPIRKFFAKIERILVFLRIMISYKFVSEIKKELTLCIYKKQSFDVAIFFGLSIILLCVVFIFTSNHGSEWPLPELMKIANEVKGVSHWFSNCLITLALKSHILSFFRTC